VRLLNDLGDERIEDTAKALKNIGFSLAESVAIVSQLMQVDGGIRNRIGWLKSMLARGSKPAFRYAQKKGSTPNSRDPEAEAELRRTYENLLRQWHSRGTQDEERAAIAAKGLAVRRKLEALGVNVEKLKSKLGFSEAGDSDSNGNGAGVSVSAGQSQSTAVVSQLLAALPSVAKSAKPKSKLGLLERTANGGYKCAVHGDLSSNFIVNGKCGRCLAKERLRPALGVGGSRLLDDETEAKERELSSATVRDAGAD